MMVSVILPAYVPNEELLEVTRKCLDSLKATTERESYQLVIVDNGSYGKAMEELWSRREIRNRDVYLGLDRPVGYARAANIGLAVASHDWLVVINTDIEFTHEGWLDKFQEDYASTQGGVLSAMDDGRQGFVYDESWFSCWITGRETIQRVGYFDESLPYRFHDQDYAIRLTRAGYRVMRTGNVQVKHIDSATYDTMGRDEDPEEAAEMLRRWGAVDFAAWMRLEQPA